MKYSISDLAYMKGTPELVRNALFALEDKISNLEKRNAELEQALRDVKEWVDRYTSPGHPVSTVCAKALEGKE